MSNAMLKVKVAVVATDGNGEPALFCTELEVSQADYFNGEHYDAAKAIAENRGYEHPMIAFDKSDSAAKELIEAATWFNA